MTIEILDLKASQTRITYIKRAGKKLDEDIHRVAVSGIAHYLGVNGEGERVNDGGDLTVLTELCHAMPRSARGNSLKYWVTSHIRVQWDKKAYGGNGGWKKNGETEGEPLAILTAAAGTPFFEKTDTEQAVFDPEKYRKSVVAKLKREASEGHVNLEQFIASLTADLHVAA